MSFKPNITKIYYCWPPILDILFIRKEHLHIYLFTSNLSADNSKKKLDLDGSTPEPAIRSSDTGHHIPCFDSCQLITTLMSNMCALSVFLCPQTVARKYEIEHLSWSSKNINWSADSFQIYHVTSMSWHMSPQYGHVVLVSGYPVLTAVNGPFW